MIAVLSPVVIAVFVFVAVAVIAAASTIVGIHRGGLQLGQVHVTYGLEVASGLPSRNTKRTKSNTLLQTYEQPKRKQSYTLMSGDGSVPANDERTKRLAVHYLQRAANFEWWIRKPRTRRRGVSIRNAFTRRYEERGKNERQADGHLDAREREDALLDGQVDGGVLHPHGYTRPETCGRLALFLSDTLPLGQRLQSGERGAWGKKTGKRRSVNTQMYAFGYLNAFF